MKKTLLFFSIFYSLGVHAQMDSTLAKFGKLDFAIPDHPAFSILDNNPDNILKPGNSQELVSLIYSNFLNGKRIIIPQDLSFEFSPVQLFGINKITFEDYRKNGKRIKYDAKVSVGAKTSENGDTVHNLAIGLRFTWFDKSSLTSNQDFIDAACKGLKIQAKDEHAFILELISNGQTYNDSTFQEDDIASNNALKAFVDSLYKVFKANSNDSRFFSIKALREKYKNELWNKFKFETALAIKFGSPDSLIGNSRYSKFQLYNTLAFPLGKSGQWLWGVNFSDERHDSLQTIPIDSFTFKMDTIKYHVSSGTLASRFYVGANSFKAFIEGSGKYGSDKIMKIALNFGTELNLSDGIWVLLNMGNNWSESTDSKISDRKWSSDLFWKVDLRFHLPEKMKL